MTIKVGSTTIEFENSDTTRLMREKQLEFACKALGCKVQNKFDFIYKIKHNSLFGRTIAELSWLDADPSIECDEKDQYRVIAIVGLLEHILGCKWDIRVTVKK